MSRISNNLKNIFLDFKDPYKLINSILILFIIGLFAYFLIFSPDTWDYPIHSANDSMTGEPSLSTGLSRGISSVLRGNFSEARLYNPYSMRVAAFFLLQLFFRIFYNSFLTSVESMDRRTVIKTDIIISVGLFLVFFEPFLSETFQITHTTNHGLFTMVGSCYVCLSSKKKIEIPKMS